MLGTIPRRKNAMSTKQHQGYAKDSWNTALDKQKKANILQI
jgi:hypothetical protein